MTNMRYDPNWHLFHHILIKHRDRKRREFTFSPYLLEPHNDCKHGVLRILSTQCTPAAAMTIERHCTEVRTGCVFMSSRSATKSGVRGKLGRIEKRCKNIWTFCHVSSNAAAPRYQGTKTHKYLRIPARPATRVSSHTSETCNVSVIKYH